MRRVSVVSSSLAKFVTPPPSGPAVLTFTLCVTDSLGLTDPTPDEVVVTVQAAYRVYLPFVIRQ